MPKCCLMLPKLTAPDPKQLAEELIAAAGLCQPVPPFSLRYESFTATKAAAVRQAWLDLKAASGCRAAGKKIGKISFGWNGHTQVLRPGWGHILDSTLLVDGTALPCSHLIQPSVEAEFALLLNRDLAGPGITAAHALAAIEGVCAAFEIVDSRFQPKALTPEDAIADNSSHAYAVIGPHMGSPRAIDLAEVGVNLEINDQVRGQGTGAAIYGNPVHALAALANFHPLRAGEIILTGSVAGAFPIKSGDRLRATFRRLGAVNLTIE